MKVRFGYENLRSFRYVANFGSFSKAAPKLNLTQSALTRQIQKLEDDVGFVVFIRNRSGVQLTAQGEHLMEFADTIFGTVDQAKERLLEHTRTESGTLRIAGAETWMSILYFQHLKEFHQEYPKVNLSIKIIQNMPDFNFDDAEVVILPRTNVAPGIIQFPLASFEMGLYASQSYLDEHGVPKSPEDLHEHTLLNYGSADNLFSKSSWHLNLGTKSGETHRPYIQVNSAPSLMQLVSLGVGIGTFTIGNPQLKSFNLVRILPEHKSTPQELCMMYPKELEKYSLIQIFRDFIHEKITQTPIKS